MAKCSVKGHTINSDPNPFEYSISNRIVLVHLWSSNTDLAMFQQDFLSFSLPLSSSPSLRVSITFASTPFKPLPLFQSYSQDYTLTHLYPLFFFFFLPPEHFRSLLEWEWRLLGNLCSGKQRLKISDYKRGRERSGGITTFFFACVCVKQVIYKHTFAADFAELSHTLINPHLARVVHAVLRFNALCLCVVRFCNTKSLAEAELPR